MDLPDSPFTANPAAPAAVQANAESAAVGSAISVGAAPPLTTGRLRRWTGVLHAILVVELVALAALLAALPIRNSTFWVHLAAGRQLVERPADFGAEPFLHTSATDRWVNPNWLFDVLSYGLYSAVGGVGLGALKSAAAALLAVVLLLAGRAGRGWWLPVGGAALALLAMGHRLWWEPWFFSVLGVGLVVLLLERNTAGKVDEPAPVARWWPLPVLCAVWANLDGWFFLGPLAIGCYWIGGLLARGGSARRVPVWVPITSLLAGLLTPNVHRAFEPPAELTFRWLQPELSQHPLFRDLVLSPLSPAYYESGFALTWPGLAYAVLVVLGLLSFVLNRDERSWGRFLFWFALFVLSLCQARNVPFFAAAAGPMLARNFFEYAARHARDMLGDEELRRRQAITGRFGAAVVGLALLALAVVGRLQPGTPEPRAWGAEPEPSLARAAEQVEAWRVAGRLPESSRGFNLAPEAANHFAWFGRAERSFFDTRLRASLPAAADFLTVRDSLTAPPGGDGRAADWDAVLQRRGVDHVIVYDRDPVRTEMALERLVAPGGAWDLVAQFGRVALFARRGSAAARAAGGVGRDPSERAFRPTEAEQAPRVSVQAAPPTWWAPLLPSRVPPSLDRDEAVLQLMMFDARKFPTLRANLRLWEASQAAGALALPSAPGGWVAAGLHLNWLGTTLQAPPRDGPPDGVMREALLIRRGFLLLRDEAPPGHLWTAVRAARRALRDIPQDGEANLRLGEAYCRLVWNTRERTWDLFQVGQLRRTQAIFALKEALRLRPQLDLAHTYLMLLYREIGLPELALRHALLYRDSTRPGESPTQRQFRIAPAEKEVTDLEEELHARRAEYEKRRETLNVGARAQLAQRLGLGQLALDLLLESDVAAFGRQGMLAELELLLLAGRIPEARAWLEDRHERFLGTGEFRWLKTRIAAATGDYDAADEHLRKLTADSARLAELGEQRIDLTVALAIAVGGEVMRGAALATAREPYSSMATVLTDPTRRVGELINGVRQEAKLALLRGLLDLESGDVRRAGKHLRRVRDLTAAEEQSDGPARVYYVVAGQLLETLSAAARDGPRPIERDRAWTR